MTEHATFTNGHRIVEFNRRFLCSRCGSVLLTMFQFTSTECPKRKPE